MVGRSGRHRVEASSAVKAIRVEPEAGQELAAAVAWYEQRREGLGREFLAAIDAVFAAIASTPNRFSPYPHIDPQLRVRRALPSRFPYAVAFIDLDSVIRVLAVAHERRRPGYWTGRVK
jgi:toxin ParE1/3/4